eukprot:UN28571
MINIFGKNKNSVSLSDKYKAKYMASSKTVKLFCVIYDNKRLMDYGTMYKQRYLRGL